MSNKLNYDKIKLYLQLDILIYNILYGMQSKNSNLYLLLITFYILWQNLVESGF